MVMSAALRGTNKSEGSIIVPVPPFTQLRGFPGRQSQIRERVISNAVKRKMNGTIAEQCGFIFASTGENRCMQFDDSRSGDHLETGPENSAVVANIPERQGVTGHNVRYVLFCGLAAVIIAFGLLLVSYLS
jgi:hypothetical protein